MENINDITQNDACGGIRRFIPIACICLLASGTMLAQSFSTPDYFKQIARPTKLFKQKKYEEAAIAYSEAFKANNNKGAAEDRFRAACAWAAIERADSAFAQLNVLLERASFDEYDRLANEPLLRSLHPDSRWSDVMNRAKNNYDSRQVVSSDIIQELEAMGKVDQELRKKWETYEKRYGFDDARTAEVVSQTVRIDSLNTARLKEIIAQIGWPGFKEVGYEANVAAFLVVQHADSASQTELLPLMRSAVTEHKAYPADLAMLEDRVNAMRCKEQVYGTQIRVLPETGMPCIFKVADPVDLDERRAKLGLQPMGEYVKFWKLSWDPFNYVECPCEMK